MSKSESKYFNTARRMDEAFLSLINKKEYEYITVKEICAKAGVNRSTFYLHYETMEDLLRESLEYHKNTLVDYFENDHNNAFDSIDNDSLENLYFINKEYLEPYLRFVKDNKSLFVAVLKHPNVFHASEIFQGLVEHILDPIMERFHIPSVDRKYMLVFYVKGLMGIVSEWLKNDCNDSIEYISEVMQKCVNNISENDLK